MTLGQPSALALLFLALPIVLIYLLRAHPRRRPTTAAFLWRGLEQQVTARGNWRRLPRSLALLLQLLALIASVAALAQPSLGERTSRQLIYVLDASPSMQATDLAPSRFEAARSAIHEEVKLLHEGEHATLIALEANPRVLAAGPERLELLRALEAAEPGARPVSLRDALAMASERIQYPPREGSGIVVFTDGTLDPPTGVGPLALPVRFVRVGQEGGNQGVSSLQVRQTQGQAAQLSGFAVLTNYADEPVRVPVRVAVDDLTLQTQQADLPARGRAELPFDVPLDARSVSVALGGRDYLRLDDRAEVTIPENRRRMALLVSRSPEAWEHALSSVSSLEVTTQAPGSYRDIGAEIVVFDGFLPPRLPSGQLVVVNPVSGNGLVDVLGEARDVRMRSFAARQPLLRSLDPAAIHLVKASRLGVPRWASTVAETEAGPVILQGDLEGRRVVVIGFDPLLSGLEKLVSFPILVANIAEFLGSSGADPFVAPGQPVTLALAPEAVQVELERPDGTHQAIASRGSGVLIEATSQVGRYTMRQRLPHGEVAARSFSVNLFGEREADIAPREIADWPAAEPLLADAARPGPSVWLPFVALALAILGAEWMHFVRSS